MTEQNRAHPSGDRKENRKRLLRCVWNARGLYFLLLGPVVYLFIYNYQPMYGAIIAFKNYSVRKGIMGSPWADPLFYNFDRFFSSPLAKTVIVNTLALSLYGLLTFPIPICFAILLNYMPSNKYRRATQMVSFSPYFLSTVLLVGLMALFLSTQGGPVNLVIQSLGGKPVNFMGDPKLFRHVYIWSGVWAGMGYNAVIYISALSSVDPQMHESAVIDGASIVQRIRYIDIPSIAPTVVIMLIMSMGSIFVGNFEKVYLMQNAQNMATADTIETYLYRVGISSGLPNYSLSTAIGLFQNVVGVTMTLIVNFISQRVSGSGLF